MQEWLLRPKLQSRRVPDEGGDQPTDPAMGYRLSSYSWESPRHIGVGFSSL